jgi:general stress protein 26
MKKEKIVIVGIFALCLIAAGCGLIPTKPDTSQAQAQSATPAKEIVAAAEVDSGHPEIEPGLSCNDCHEIKLDAQTTATQHYLFGQTPGHDVGEGVYPKERVWQEIEKAIGGIKHDSKTFILATSLNNVPLSTTCEWTLDTRTKKLYGFHEAGTEKLRHIEANPKVSMNYHKEFDSETFKDFLCVQIRGTARLIKGDDPDFERIMIELLPYEFGARVPADATPEQREARLKAFRQGVKNAFVISEITPTQITIANQQFRAEGMRVYQRWTP